jgi:hypothetical protein
MKRSTVKALGVALVFTAGCQKVCPPAPPPPPVNPGDLPAFVGTVWVGTSAGAARGSILVFLPDKSVLIDSCNEGLRVSQWGIISANRIRVLEGAVPIEFEYSQLTPQVLDLKPVGKDVPESYIRATVPYACPEGSK